MSREWINDQPSVQHDALWRPTLVLALLRHWAVCPGRLAPGGGEQGRNDQWLHDLRRSPWMDRSGRGGGAHPSVATHHFQRSGSADPEDSGLRKDPSRGSRRDWSHLLLLAMGYRLQQGLELGPLRLADQRLLCLRFRRQLGEP